ncbi:ATP-grasp domain-containing protein [Streptomyces sp. 4F14]|uniref:ATP-grasp domain-containing protein n=1 Tax=Streptomyces sp. 4F14 TaxID=3394380 RepID=UPI003A8C5BB5
MTARARTEPLDRLDATLRSRSGLRLRLVCPSQEFSAREMSFGVGRWLSSSRGLWESLRVACEADLAVVMLQAPAVGPAVEGYLLDLVPSDPATAADRRARHALVEIDDDGERHLSEKVLDDPRLLRRLARTVALARRAGHAVEGLAGFASSPRMASLAHALDVELLEADTRLLGWGGKSGSRQLFRAAHVPHLPGSYLPDHDVAALAARLAGLVRAHGPGRWFVKLDHGFGSGHGNAVVTVDDDSPYAVERALRTSLRPLGAGVRRTEFLGRLGSVGAVVERHAGALCAHPSALAHLGRDARVELLGVHDQLVGAAGDFLGCRYPARARYRDAVERESLKVFTALAVAGVSGHAGVDFLASGTALYATEVNLRQTGSTHPHRTVRAVLPLDLRTPGLLVSRDGRPVCFRATDSVLSPSCRGLSTASLIAALRTSPRLRLDREAGRGVVPHLWPALGRFGKMGVTAVGRSARECEELVRDFGELLDSLGESGRVGA